MLDINFIRQNPEVVKQASKNKGVNVDIDALLDFDRNRAQLLRSIESLRAERNKFSKSSPDQETIQKAKMVKEEIQKTEKEFKKVDERFKEE